MRNRKTHREIEKLLRDGAPECHRASRLLRERISRALESADVREASEPARRLWIGVGGAAAAAVLVVVNVVVRVPGPASPIPMSERGASLAFARAVERTSEAVQNDLFAQFDRPETTFRAEARLLVADARQLADHVGMSGGFLRRVQ